ncbi:MAG: hypothetical protein JO255_04360, partial [Alphaproteobacteria bacterium]|nr:hypothetical protein [Alphaproteobacteria bacterium]
MMRVRKPITGLAAILMIAAPMLGAVAAMAQVTWPALPATGFVAGRAALPEDIDKGDAVFAVKATKPLPVTIPQYGIL